MFFTDHFRQCLLGRKFSLRTDHQSISWIQNFKEPQGQLARWLEQYDFTIVHRAGKRQGNADAFPNSGNGTVQETKSAMDGTVQSLEEAVRTSVQNTLLQNTC